MTGTGRAPRVAARVLRSRLVVRAPIWLFRARVGALLGGRLLLLEHVGRLSGLLRQVVLEVVDHPTPGRWVVVSGFGERAQWLRNVTVTPDVQVQVGSRRAVAAIATRLGPSEAAEALRRYAHRHPRSWAQLRPVLENTLGAAIDQTGTSLPVVALDRVAEPDPARRGGRRPKGSH